MLVPKRVKHRKVQRGHMRGEAKGGKTVTFGEFGLQALDSHWISNRQIEAARIAMTRYMKRGGKVWIKIFPQLSYTSKGVGVRMGNGKGAPEGWVAPVKRGKVMFEVGGVSEEVAREALRLAGHKLPVRTKIVQREEVLNGLTTDKLLDREKELKEQLFNLRFQLATGQLENTASLKKVRKDIARVKTVLRQQELNK
nr:50S ribosomal protein L16 [Limosilactobacillus oris]